MAVRTMPAWPRAARLMEMTMKAAIRTVSALAFAFAVILTATPAGAQQRCLPRSDAVNQLEEKYKEQVVGRGLVPGDPA